MFRIKNKFLHFIHIPIDIFFVILSIYFVHVIAGIIYVIIFIVPYIYINYDYYKRSNKINISAKASGFSIESPSKSLFVQYGEINKIVSVITRPHHEDRTLWYPWDAYNYSVIYFGDEKLLITSFSIDFHDLPKIYEAEHIILNVIYPIILK